MLLIWYSFATLCLVVGAPSTRDLTSTAMYTRITSTGYFAETHQVTTEDGYILGVFRMPYARYQTSADEDRPVVFLQHGLYGESINFILAEPEIGFAFNLADAGFDVWFGNARGNVHSRAHVSLDPDVDSREFFDFSWDEIGVYDLPAMIDYILNYTGKEQLHYIGHSQGGTVFLVMASMRTDYNEKMASVHLLAPAGYPHHFPDPELKQLAQFSDIIYALALQMGLSEVSLDLVEAIMNENENATRSFDRADYCFGDIKYKEMCELVGVKQFMRNMRDTEEVFGFGGGAVKQIAHYGQNIRDYQFRRFNYGSLENLDIYGADSPPIYDLGLITSNVVMHYSLNDTLVDGQDVLAMTADMPNAVARQVARESFDHGDYVVAIDAKELVTDFVIQSIFNVHNGVSEGENEAVNEAENEADGTEEETAPIITEESTDDAVHSSLSLIFKIYLSLYTLYVFL